MKKEELLMPNALAAQDSGTKPQMLKLRNLVEMFRGGLCTIEPLFIGARDLFGGRADTAEIMDLIRGYARSHDDRGTIGSCLMLKAVLRHRLIGESAWYQEWHPFFDHLEALYWEFPVKKNIGGREANDLVQFTPTLQDARFWIADQIAVCWQVEQTESSRRAFRFLMATFGTVGGDGYPTGDREYSVSEGYCHFNEKLIDRIRRTIIDKRITAIRDHLPPGNRRAQYWEAWLDYSGLPASVASRLNAEWAAVMPARDLAVMRTLYRAHNGKTDAPSFP